MLTRNLNPVQRQAVRRMRQALALLPEPERRMILDALREFWQTAAGPLLACLERHTALEFALALAQEERLGHEPEEGEPVTPLDDVRAQEILALYPKSEAG